MLVGMTGHATGPHLHLQIDPPTSYPQVEPWFQSFAGVAFRWQDAPTPMPQSGPVFEVLGQPQAPPAPVAAPADGSVIGFTLTGP